LRPARRGGCFLPHGSADDELGRKAAMRVLWRVIFCVLVLFVGSSRFSWALAEADIHVNQIPRINAIVLDPAEG
jgi:hypothetical protein